MTGMQRLIASAAVVIAVPLAYLSLGGDVDVGSGDPMTRDEAVTELSGLLGGSQCFGDGMLWITYRHPVSPQTPGGAPT